MKNNLELREERFAMIRRWQESGLTQKQFCINENWTMNNFQHWLKRFRKVNLPATGENVPGEKSSAFVKLKMPPKNISGNPFSEVVFANGNSIRFYDRIEISQLKQLAI